MIEGELVSLFQCKTSEQNVINKDFIHAYVVLNLLKSLQKMI